MNPESSAALEFVWEEARRFITQVCWDNDVVKAWDALSPQAKAVVMFGLAR